MELIRIIKQLFSKKAVETDSNQAIKHSIDNKKLVLTDKTLTRWIKEEEELKNEIQNLKTENATWSRHFNRMTSMRADARELEKKNKLNDALELYKKSYSISINDEYLSYNNYVFDIKRIIILYGKLKLYTELKEFLELLIDRYGKYEDWQIRLIKVKKKLNRISEKEIYPIKEEDISVNQSDNFTMWGKINNIKSKMPEFNFYFDLPDNESTISYNNKVPLKYIQELKSLREAFKTRMNKAKLAEAGGNLKEAIEIYETLIAEKCEESDPYDKLIVIYSKLKWIDREIYTLKRAVSFFEELKVKQLNHISYLANKYGMEEKANEYIYQDKKIYYFMGTFELYNPQSSKLKKWKNRLIKKENERI